MNFSKWLHEVCGTTPAKDFQNGDAFREKGVNSKYVANGSGIGREKKDFDPDTKYGYMKKKMKKKP